MSETASVNVSMRKLKALQSAVGVGNAGRLNDEPKADLSKMTPYQAKQFQVADKMRIIRTLMTELDEIPEGSGPTRRIEINNQIRKEERNISTGMKEARTLALQEQKMSEYEDLQGHFKTTQQLWRARSGVVSSPSDSGPSGYGAMNKSGGGKAGREASIELEAALPAPGGYNIREDGEFAMFFQQTQQNDLAMHKALDRIQQGVQRLAENATLLNQELKIQDVLLDETEKKVDGVHAKMKGLNKTLKETIKKVDNDRLCLYVFCCLILLGLAGGIYYVIKDKN
ncbi:transmembrane protein, putative [Bodo saltans]|uniref:Transmembrane protein, putative n=1 Tax=Bodo saltans TaxID=75058 RepID=A0A0S4JMS3_BODSA|nr:transmembrane protein, putative [Bodo saltans]|eukprot:CUG91952.1 transmembrane protein, putative [Bodo saltans]